jgi:hypothetical protein
MNEPQPPVAARGSGAITGGVICLVLGILLMFASLWTIILYVPLFLASFVLGIVAMSQSRTGAGVMILLASLIVPFILFVVLGAARTADLAHNLSAASAAADDEKLEIQSWNCQNASAGSSMMVVVGEVKNVGSAKLDAIQAKGNFYTKDGALIDTGSAILDTNPLMPGQTTTFKAYGPRNSAVSTCSISFTHIFGKPVRSFEKGKG